MPGFDKILETLTAATARRLKQPVIVLAIRRKKAGEFETRFCVHGLTRAEIEATALDVLRALRDEIDPDDPCPSCGPRRARAEAAIAALEQGEGSPDRNLH